MAMNELRCACGMAFEDSIVIKDSLQEEDKAVALEASLMFTQCGSATQSLVLYAH